MTKLPQYRLFYGALLALDALLAGCDGAGKPASRATAVAKTPAGSVAPAPLPVAEVARHYADMLARDASLATPASRTFAGVVPTSQPASAAGDSYSVVLTLALPNCQVHAFLDRRQHLADVEIGLPRPPEDPNRLTEDVRLPPARLVRLGELRRAFGKGASSPKPFDFQYCFTYRPVPAGPPLTIKAFLPYPAFADSMMVDHLTIFKTTAE